MVDLFMPLFFGFGGQEIIVILIIVLILFGGKKIPELMRGLGRGVTEFKKGSKAVYDDINNADGESNKDESKNGK